jgi:hypothetical protein
MTGERLVEDDDRRVGGERARDRDSLPLAARELVWEPPRRAGCQADLFEELGDARAALCARREAERRQRLGDLLADPPPRVERRERILEDHLKARELARAGAARQGADVVPLEANRSRRRRDHPDGRTGQRRLPAARLADEPDDLAAVDIDACADDRAHR